MFPVTEIVKRIYPYSVGFQHIEDTALYTTQGTWLFGPRMRLGSRNEIVVFTVLNK